MSFLNSTNIEINSAKAKKAQRSRDNSRRAKIAVTVVLLAVIGAAIIDGVSIAVTSAKVSDQASRSAYAAVRVTTNKTVDKALAEQAYAAAVAEVTDPNMNVARTGANATETFTVATDGAVTLTVVKQAPTLLLGRIPTFDGLTRVSETFTQAFLG